MNAFQKFNRSSAVALMTVAALTGCASKPKAAKPATTAVVAPAPAPTRPTVARTGTLYERLGGEQAIRKVVDDFVARASTDPAVNFARKGHASTWEPTTQNVERLKERLVQFIATTANGPSKYQYRGRDMVTAHRGMGITAAEFDALAAHLAAALKANDVPARESEELMCAVESTRGAIVESTGSPTAAPIASTPTEPATTDGQPGDDDAEAPQAAAPQDEVAPNATTPAEGEEPTGEDYEAQPEASPSQEPTAEGKSVDAAPEQQDSAEAPEYDAAEPR